MFIIEEGNRMKCPKNKLNNLLIAIVLINLMPADSYNFNMVVEISRLAGYPFSNPQNSLVARAELPPT
jgi:hypothetical protein